MQELVLSNENLVDVAGKCEQWFENSKVLFHLPRYYERQPFPLYDCEAKIDFGIIQDKPLGFLLLGSPSCFFKAKVNVGDKVILYTDQLAAFDARGDCLGLFEKF